MILYCNILIGASIILTCLADSASNQAVSSLSYERGDVPLSYKYSLIHEYSTPKPYASSNHNLYADHNNMQRHAHVENYENIQYAPLPLKSQDGDGETTEKFQQERSKVGNYIETNPAYIQDSVTQPEIGQKSYFDPTFYPVKTTNFQYQRYVPGYNVNLQSVHNKLTQTRFYARNPNLLVKNKQININYLQPQLLTYQTQNEPKPNARYLVSAQHSQDVNKYNQNNVPGKERSEMQSTLYVKAPEVVLNLAQSRKIAHATQKAPLNVNTNFKKIPSHPQEFFSNLQLTKTQLYPVQNGKVDINNRGT